MATLTKGSVVSHKGRFWKVENITVKKGFLGLGKPLYTVMLSYQKRTGEIVQTSLTGNAINLTVIR